MSDSSLAPKIIGFCIGHEGVVTALHFINETDDIVQKPSLLSGTDIGEIFIWNLETERTYHRFRGHDGKKILYLNYYKSSLISHGRDGNIHVWKFVNNKWNVINTFECSKYGFCSSVLLPTESFTYLVAPTGDEFSLTFYDFETSNGLYNFTPEADTDTSKSRGMCMAMKLFVEDTKIFILMGYDGGYISLWDHEANKEASNLKCHPEVVLCLDYDSKHKNRGISGSVDDTIQVWAKTKDNQLLEVKKVGITNPGINAVKIRDDGKIAITAGQDGYIRIFSWKSMKPLSVLCSHRQPVFSLQYRLESFGKKNSLIFASGSQDKNICLMAVYF